MLSSTELPVRSRTRKWSMALEQGTTHHWLTTDTIQSWSMALEQGTTHHWLTKDTIQSWSMVLEQGTTHHWLTTDTIQSWSMVLEQGTTHHWLTKDTIQSWSMVLEQGTTHHWLTTDTIQSWSMALEQGTTHHWLTTDTNSHDRWCWNRAPHTIGSLQTQTVMIHGAGTGHHTPLAHYRHNTVMIHGAGTGHHTQLAHYRYKQSWSMALEQGTTHHWLTTDTNSHDPWRWNRAPHTIGSLQTQYSHDPWRWNRAPHTIGSLQIQTVMIHGAGTGHHTTLAHYTSATTHLVQSIALETETSTQKTARHGNR